MKNEQNQINRYTVSQKGLDFLQTKIEKLNKKAIKLGCNPIKLSILDNYSDCPDNIHRVKYYIITVEGAAPVLKNWEFMATIVHSPEGNIIHTALNKNEHKIAEQYRVSLPVCEHCSVRRYRKDTYIVRNTKNNKLKQIGRTCLSNFLGGTNPQAFVTYALGLDFLKKHIKHATDIKNFDNFSDFNIDLGKFMDHVSQTYLDFLGHSETKRPGELARIAYDRMVGGLQNSVKAQRGALGVIEWGKGLTERDFSTYTASARNYFENLRVIFQNYAIDRRSLPLAASAINAMIRDLSPESTKPKAFNEYIGKKGEKIEISVQLKSVKGFPSNWGGTIYLYTFHTGEGNIIKWFHPKLKGTVETHYTLNGLVKDHTEYKGQKQTMVKNVKLT